MAIQKTFQITEICRLPLIHFTIGLVYCHMSITHSYVIDDYAVFWISTNADFVRIFRDLQKITWLVIIEFQLEIFVILNCIAIDHWFVFVSHSKHKHSWVFIVNRWALLGFLAYGLSVFIMDVKFWDQLLFTWGFVGFDLAWLFSSGKAFGVALDWVVIESITFKSISLAIDIIKTTYFSFGLFTTLSLPVVNLIFWFWWGFFPG